LSLAIWKTTGSLSCEIPSPLLTSWRVKYSMTTPWKWYYLVI
jgi:hypothetical protein